MAPRQKRLIEGDYHVKEDLKLDLSDMKRAALVCRALSSETRLQILNALIERSMTVSQLAEYFYLPVSSMSVHVHILEEAGLVTSISNPGVRGTKKLCGISASSVVLDLFAHKKEMPLQKAPVYVNMPVGNYSDCEIIPPCGIVSTNLYLYQEDSPYGFYMPEHIHASLVWLTGGYLDYRFPNEALTRDHPSRIQFSFEISLKKKEFWLAELSLSGRSA
jgi:predicted transcriptional regulator